MGHTFVNEVSRRYLSVKYKCICDDLFKNIRPFEGVVCLDKLNLHIIKCESIIAPLNLSIDIIDKIFEENLRDKKLKYMIVCETKKIKNL